MRLVAELYLVEQTRHDQIADGEQGDDEDHVGKGECQKALAGQGREQ